MSIQFFYFMEFVKETKWAFYIEKYLCFNYNTGSIIYKIKILKQSHYMWNQCRLQITAVGHWWIIGTNGYTQEGVWVCLFSNDK